MGWDYPFWFLANFLVEWLVAYGLGYRDWKAARAVFLVNLFTHPLLTGLLLLNAAFGWFALNLLSFLVLEALVVASEAMLLESNLALERQAAWKLSLVMNACSALAGLLIFWSQTRTWLGI